MYAFPQVGGLPPGSISLHLSTPGAPVINKPIECTGVHRLPTACSVAPGDVINAWRVPAARGGTSIVAAATPVVRATPRKWLCERRIAKHRQCSARDAVCGVTRRPAARSRNQQRGNRVPVACSSAQRSMQRIHPPRRRWRPPGAEQSGASVRATPCGYLRAVVCVGRLPDPTTAFAGSACSIIVRDRSEHEPLAVRFGPSPYTIVVDTALCPR
jgi:hypothetical protein